MEKLAVLIGRVFSFEAPEQKTLLERVTHDITSVSGELASEFSVSRYCLMLCAELFWLLSFSQIKATRFCLVFQFPVVLTRHTHMCGFFFKYWGLLFVFSVPLILCQNPFLFSILTENSKGLAQRDLRPPESQLKLLRKEGVPVQSLAWGSWAGAIVPG